MLTPLAKVAATGRLPSSCALVQKVARRTAPENSMRSCRAMKKSHSQKFKIQDPTIDFFLLGSILIFKAKDC